MEWLRHASYLFAAILLTNAVPHFVSGITGHAFQSPFAAPPGQGLSSAMVNVLWGFLNLAVGYVFLLRVGDFDLRSTSHAAVFGFGVLLAGLVLGHRFGRFNGGNLPGNS